MNNTNNNSNCFNSIYNAFVSMMVPVCDACEEVSERKVHGAAGRLNHVDTSLHSLSKIYVPPVTDSDERVMHPNIHNRAVSHMKRANWVVFPNGSQGGA